MYDKKITSKKAYSYMTIIKYRFVLNSEEE